MSAVKKLTVAAILTALCIIFLYVGSLLPAVKISAVAIAGLLPAVAVIHCGYVWASGVYVAAGLLSLLLLPEKTCVIWFLIVFGHYGIFKSLLEQIENRVAEWALKLALFAVCIAIMFLLFHAFFIAALPQYAEWLLFFGLLICFVLYDIAFSALISFYQRRIQPHVE